MNGTASGLLEPCAGKLASTVLRGRGAGDSTLLPDKALGAMVRKGERGSCVVYYNKTICEDKATGEEKAIPFLKSYSVFNADQIDGLPEEFTTVRPDRGTRPVDELEAFFAATGADIRTTGTQPCYVHGSDHIEMPPISTFETPESFYLTLAHESIHWVGVSKRLDRNKACKTRHERALEEITAECGSVFLCHELGVKADIEQSASYCEGWLTALKDDKTFIFKAAADAQKASDYICDLVATANTKREAA